jgi:adenylate cyclase
MTASVPRRLKTALILMTVCIPVALGFELIDTGRISLVGLAIGALLAAPLALLEESAFDERMRRLPFSVALLTKVFAYLGSLVAVFGSAGLVFGLMQGLTMTDYRASFLEPDFVYQMAVGFVMYVVIVFFRQLDRILGPGVLLSYLLGRYHRPHREARIFMFLDLKSSTTIAEQLGAEAYLDFVNDFFRDISGPVLDNAGEIYEYVGDEVVLTWKQERGLKSAQCLQVFFDIDTIIESRRDRYMDRYGVVPEYRAGVHLGEVMTAEIGDLKKGLVFNGDVLNTGARIQGECARLGKRLVSSAKLVDCLTLPAGWGAEYLGPVPLRGKADPVELVAFA